MDQSYAYLYYDGTAAQTLNTPVQIDVENGTPVYSYSNVIFNNANVSGYIGSFIQGSNYGGVVLERDGIYEIDFNFVSNTRSPLGIYIKAKKGNGFIVASFDDALNEYKYTYHGKKGDMISIVASGTGPYNLDICYHSFILPSTGKSLLACQTCRIEQELRIPVIQRYPITRISVIGTHWSCWSNDFQLHKHSIQQLQN